VRALVISDTHFGTWTGDPLLVREFARARLRPQIDEVDEVVLLGDVFDFLFSSVDYAFQEADPFFEMLARSLRGKRLTFLAGNHDHHLVVRTLRSAIETKVATGTDGEDLARMFEMEYRSFFQRYLDRRLQGVDCRIVYPTYRVGDVLLTHGHYLDAHLAGSVPNRIQARATRTIGGVNGDMRLSEQDYEAVIVPLGELLFTVAQMPRGCAVQKAFHRRFERIGKVLRLTQVVRGRARGGVARSCDPTDEPGTALAPFAKVVRDLGWELQARQIVFAHSHQPLDGVAYGDVRFWNTGSWIYEPPLRSFDAYVRYCRRAWPGTAVLVDTEAAEPQLLETLADQNPLNGGTPRGGEMLRSDPDMLTRRAGRFAHQASSRAAA
jgi:hypothetical protein